MVSARRNASLHKQSATAATINEFLLEGTLISVSSVAQASGVSRNFIYSHQVVLHQLEAARKTQVDSGTVPRQRQPTNGAPGHAALMTELALANQTIKRLRRDLTDVHARHEHCLGEQLSSRVRTDPADPDSQSDQTHQMTEENQSLHQRIEALTHRISDLTDDLTAERRAAAG